MCVFCDRDKFEHLIVSETPLSWVIINRFPLSKIGHFLIVTKEHVPRFTQLSEEQKADAMALLDDLMRKIEERICPEGVNVSFNQGETAGQSQPHFHIHVFCRSTGDGIVNFRIDEERREIDIETTRRLKSLMAYRGGKKCLD